MKKTILLSLAIATAGASAVFFWNILQDRTKDTIASAPATAEGPKEIGLDKFSEPLTTAINEKSEDADAEEAPPASVSYDTPKEDLDIYSDEKFVDFWEWSHQTGFPTSKTDDLYSPSSLSKLTLLADQGDLIASYWAGYRLANQGNIETARRILIDAVSNGSIGAAQLLSQIYGGQYNVEMDRAEAVAWSRVAQSMGGGPDYLHPNLDHAEWFLADNLFFIYWKEVQARYQAEYGVPMPYRPQPSAQGGNSP